MANRNGLNHKVRAFKGIGWNRALPAPFEFGRGLVADGSNDYLKIPGLIGTTWPTEGCIEFWCSVVSVRGQREVEIQFNDGSNLRVTAYNQPIPVVQSAARMPGSSPSPNGIYSYGTKYHCCYMWDSSKLYAWGNSVLPNLFTNTAITSSMNLTVVGVSIAGQVDGTLCSNTKLDEVRFYNRKLLLDELVLNDNSGVGNNPSTTENLFAWFKFEEFETLDFSVQQDNSDLRLGVRDLSGHNNHAQQFNMDTNPASGTYVLQPF